MKLVTITWSDSSFYEGVSDADSEFTMSRVVTAGFVIGETSKVIVIASELLDDNRVQRVHVIARNQIVKMTNHRWQR